jgi:hypothetical protein
MQTIYKDRISEAIGCLSLLRVLEKSQANLRLPPLRLLDDEFQNFAALTHRIQAWLEETRLAVPSVARVSHTPDCEELKTGPADKDSRLGIEVPL